MGRPADRRVRRRVSLNGMSDLIRPACSDLSCLFGFILAHQKLFACTLCVYLDHTPTSIGYLSVFGLALTRITIARLI